jgi:hypothetical protein
MQFKNAPPACSATAFLGYFYYMLPLFSLMILVFPILNWELGQGESPKYFDFKRKSINLFCSMLSQV